jgi:hypothetical protein
VFKYQVCFKRRVVKVARALSGCLFAIIVIVKIPVKLYDWLVCSTVGIKHAKSLIVCIFTITTNDEAQNERPCARVEYTMLQRYH